MLAVFALLVLPVHWLWGGAPELSWHSGDGERLVLKQGGELVMAFQLRPTSREGRFSRSHYVHPLVGPQGHVVTEDFPADHLHHRGIFWAWHQLIVDGTPLADPWVCQGVEWKTPEQPGDWIVTCASEQAATMKVVRDWVVADPDGSGKSLPVVRDTARIKVWAAQQERRVVDFDLRLRALVPGVSLGGSDDEKGYGGFSPRVRLPDDVRFLSQLGEVAPEPLAAVAGGAWVDVCGTLDGVRQGVAIMVHPSHPSFPLPWILRPRNSMQNPRWPGREPVPLETDCDVRLRYRLVLHVGDLGHETLESLWQEFARAAD